MRSKTFRFFVVLSSLIALPAAAFDYDEHKYLSNVALRAAIDLAPDCADTGDAARFIDPANIAANRSFGDVVGLADYVRGVDVILERNGESRLKIDGYSSLDWSHIEALKRDLLRFLQAAHLNESHFQQAALLSHLNQHEAARALARADNLDRALVTEAFALHFLEDFHAPGHIAATRNGMVDYVALASHNRYNTRGLPYRFRDAAKDLLPIVDALLAHPESLAPLRHHDVRFELGREDFVELREKLVTRASMPFYGDSSLGEHQVQAAYIAVLAARSLLDLFEARCADRRGRNSFEPICWVLGPGDYPSRDCEPFPAKGVVRAAAIPYGKWEAESKNFRRIWYRPWDVNLVSYYTDSLHSTEGDLIRRQLAIESLLWSGASVNAFLQKDRGRLLNTILSTNLTVAYGYSHTFSELPSNELHVKFLYALPRVDLQVAATYGVRDYDLGRRSRRRYPLTLGLETGYGFVFVHLGISEELFINPLTGGLRARPSIRSGLTFVLPTKAGFDALGHRIGGRR